MSEFLLDSSVIHGLYNKEDKHHSICKKFLKDHKDDRFFIPSHSRFEIQHSISKRKKNKTFTRPEEDIQLNFKSIDIDSGFYQKCQEKNLFSMFDCLKGGDLIFACIAKLYGYTLVACDKHYNNYKAKINIIYLPEYSDL
jgi:predicted nucleic acid-binding protein